MANLQFGDTIKFETAKPIEIHSILDVVPVKYDTIDEQWIVVAQTNATHMLIMVSTNTDAMVEYMLIEIGKCENIYLLADAIVD